MDVLYFRLRRNDKISRYTTLKLFLAPYVKTVHSKRKEFAPMGSKFFPFRVDSFLGEALCAEQQTESHKKYLPCKKYSKCIQCPWHLLYRQACGELLALLMRERLYTLWKGIKEWAGLHQDLQKRGTLLWVGWGIYLVDFRHLYKGNN